MAVPLNFIEPELATLVDQAPSGGAWIHEIKFDGYRIAARVISGKVALITRGGLDWTQRFQAIANELRKLKRDAYLDGEIVVLTASGISDFGSLQDALSTNHQRDRLMYYVFDLLHLGGADLRVETLRDRKAKLAELLATVKMPRVRYSDYLVGGGAAFYQRACKAGLEGILSKRADAPYRSGRIGDWLKVKCTKRQELVVGGWVQSEKKGRALASLLLGYYGADGRLVYAGKVGTGFGIKFGHQLVKQLSERGRDTAPFIDVPRPETRGASWTEPRLVVEVEFTEWTRDGRIRHTSFQGVRKDKPAREVRRETPRSAKRTVPES